MKFKDLKIDLEKLSTEEKMSLLAELRTALDKEVSESEVNEPEVAYVQKEDLEKITELVKEDLSITMLFSEH